METKKKKYVRSDRGGVEKKFNINVDDNLMPQKPVKLKSFYGRNLREAEEKYQKYIRAAKGVPKSDKTLAQYCDEWLATWKEDSVSDLTFERTYKNIVENHIKRYFPKETLLCELAPSDIKRFMKSQKDFSQSLLNKCLYILRSIFEAAVEDGYISSNPAKRKEISQKSSVESRPKQAYTADQAREIIDFAKSHKDGAPIILMLKTGLRISEVFGLRWRDIDLKNMLITGIEMTVKETKKSGTSATPGAKTQASKAKEGQPFDEEMKAVFEALPRFTNIVKGRKAKGEQTVTTVLNEYVFVNAVGKVVSPHNWRAKNFERFYQDYTEYYKAKHDGADPLVLTPHEHRHTYGSLVYEATKDIHITSKLMRHANVQTTSRIYVHESISTKRDALNKTFTSTKK